MTVFASFNGGPTEAQFNVEAAVAVASALASGAISRRPVVGGAGGAAIAAGIYAGLLALSSGFLGAELLFLLFGLGGAVCGVVGWGFGRLARRLRRP